jgi:hypothetical protein
MTGEVRILLAAWAALMALSLVVAIAGDVAHPSRLGAAMMISLAAAAAIKAHLVLRYYLGLNAARGALAGFTGAVVVALTPVVGSFLVFATPR